MKLVLVVERFTTNKVSKTDEQRKDIANSANKRSSAPGVTGKASKMTGPIEELNDAGQKQYRYTFRVHLEKATYKTEDSAIKHLEAARKFVEMAAEARGWKVKGEASEVAAVQSAADSRPDFVVPELTQDIKDTYFADLRERDAHLRLIHTSVQTFRETNGEQKNHILLYGDAASAKSSVIAGFKDWFDTTSGIERVLKISATSMTKAGLEQMLLEKAQNNMLPECLWINEIEKGTASDFMCLLSVMDGLSSIQRLNSRIGKQEAKCNLLVLADCNNADIVKGWMSGALWSRFVKKLPCVRPSREVMTDILMNTMEKYKAKGYPNDRRWVKAAISYAFDVVKNNDPRFVKSLLEGKQGLLDGSYFKDLETIQAMHKIAEDAKLSLNN